MAYEDFDFGADVAAAAGKVFVNPEPGPHDSVITGIVHVGSFADVFTEGNKKDPKPPANFVLIQTTLMGENDKNEDGSRIQKWQAMPLKKGDRANLTKFMAAVDPAGKLKGFDDVIGVPVVTTWKANEKKGKNDDGTWKAVNLTGYTAATGRTAGLIVADFQAEDIKPIGHVRFENITLDVLEEIPGYLISQYFLSEKDGNNLSYAGSPVETIINAKRAEDPKWKVKQDGDDEGGSEGQSNGSSQAASDVPPPPEEVPPPSDMSDAQDF